MQEWPHVDFLDAGERGYCAPNHNVLAASRKAGRVKAFAMPTADKPPNQINTAATSKSDARQARVFVGVKVAPEIAHELARLARSLERFSVRLVPTNDIHLTLVPPWNEASIPTAVVKLRAVTDRFGAFSVDIPTSGLRPAAQTAPFAVGGVRGHR